jgi:F-type H+-transporting ATPase subunit c
MKSKITFALALMMIIAMPTFAQETTSTGAAGIGLLLPAFAMALASGLCGLGQGKAIAAALEGIARNPGAAGPIRILLILGLAFIESLALFTFVKVG